MHALALLLAGRKKVSGVHNYLNYLPDKDESKCSVNNSDERECDVEISGKIDKFKNSHVQVTSRNVS